MTDEQVENWRRMLSFTLGSYALLLTKEEIVKERDKMQNKLNEDFGE